VEKTGGDFSERNLGRLGLSFGGKIDHIWLIYRKLHNF
jgi:hypothetical protein